MSAATRQARYPGTYDPLATFSRLRAEGCLGADAYLHVSARGAEIGWSPAAALRLRASDLDADWRRRVEALTSEAASRGRKAFGFIAFDAVDGLSPALSGSVGWTGPLVDLIVPAEVVEFAADHVTHTTTGDFDLLRYLEVQPLAEPSLKPKRALVRAAGTDEAEYVAAVSRAIARIHDGELEKVVLSRFVAFDVDYDPLALFAAHGMTDPSADAFLLLFGDTTIVIASPEVLLAARAGHLLSNPLAGTRRRGSTPAEDERLRNELKHDRKEIGEHVLSVTTMLDELEPLCESGSLTVTRLLDVSLHRRVQHLSSVIEGRLAGGRSVLDALWAVYPGVTVTGAPKEAALRVMRELESANRGVFAGVIGWIAGSGDCRMSLAIRGVYRHRGRSFVHAGAGIMADSSAAAELAETEHKMSAMLEALAATQRD